MNKKQFFISLGVVAIGGGLAIGSIAGFSLSTGKTTLAKNPQSPSNFVPGLHTNQKIEDLKSELGSVVEYESSYGCVNLDANKEPKFCGESKKRIDTLEEELTSEVRALELSEKTSEQIDRIHTHIRKLNGDKGSITFQGSSANPYTNTKKRIEQWRDEKGFHYWVDPTTNRVVQFGPGPDSNIPFERDVKKSLSQSQLKLIAETYLSKNISNFETIKKEFNFRQLSKAGNSTTAFRWEAKTLLTGEETLPFIQVVLSPTGEVMSFADTRTLYSQN